MVIRGETHFSNLARTSATTVLLSMARSVVSLCSNKANMFLQSSIERPFSSFSTTWRPSDTHMYRLIWFWSSHVYVCVCVDVFTYLSCSCVWVNGDFAGPATVAVNCRCHFLSAQYGPQLLLWRNVFSSTHMPQGILGEASIPFHLGAWIQLSCPEQKISHSLISCDMVKSCPLGCRIYQEIVIQQLCISSICSFRVPLLSSKAHLKLIIKKLFKKL